MNTQIFKLSKMQRKGWTIFEKIESYETLHNGKPLHYPGGTKRYQKEDNKLSNENTVFER